MSFKIDRHRYMELFGPTEGDKIRLGDTDLIAKNIQIFDQDTLCSDTFPYFIPTSQLNQWRRQLTQI